MSSEQPNIIPRNDGLLRVTRIPLEECQIAAYYGIDEEIDGEKEISATGSEFEIPTFRADLPSLFFRSCVLNDSETTDHDQTQPTFRANLPSRLFKSSVLNDSEATAQTQPTFRANLPSRLFKSSVLDDSEATAQMQPTFRADFPSRLFKGSVLDDSEATAQIQPTFRADFPSRLFTSSVLDDSEAVAQIQPTFTSHQQMDPEFRPNYSSENSIVISNESNLNSPAPKHFRHRICIEHSPKITYQPKLTIRPDPQSLDDSSKATAQMQQTLTSHQQMYPAFRPNYSSENSIVLGNESNLNSPAPKHFHHRICIERSPNLTYQPKLIRPDPQSPSVVQLGLRRSKRTRLPRLQTHLGQRAIYDVDKDGNNVLVGATEVEVKDRRLKKYRVLDPVVAAEREQEAKYRKKLTKILMRKRRYERSKPQRELINLSSVEEEEEDD